MSSFLESSFIIATSARDLCTQGGPLALWAPSHSLGALVGCPTDSLGSQGEGLNHQSHILSVARRRERLLPVPLCSSVLNPASGRVH